jgi:uncharacterized protein
MTARLRRYCSALIVLVSSIALAVCPDAAPAQNFMWRVTDRASAIYLVGSVHLLTSDYYPLHPALESAFEDSDLLVEEADFGELLSADSQLGMLSHGMLPADTSLETVVSPATFSQLSRRVAALGIPIEPLKRMKPWLLALTLLGMEWQRAGFDPELGLDRHFYDRARAEGKPIQGLETVAFQVSRFDGMTMADQDRMLAQTLKDLDTEMAGVRTLANAWRNGDRPAVERLMLPDLKEDPRMYQRLLVDRNRTWLPKVEALFSRRGHAFVVVGAAHLVGPDGLLSILRGKGYSVDQM